MIRTRQNLGSGRQITCVIMFCRSFIKRLGESVRGGGEGVESVACVVV